MSQHGDGSIAIGTTKRCAESVPQLIGGHKSRWAERSGGHGSGVLSTVINAENTDGWLLGLRLRIGIGDTRDGAWLLRSHRGLLVGGWLRLPIIVQH